MASESTYKLSNKPLKLSEIPTEAAIITEGQAVLESTHVWKPGKTFFKVVNTYSRLKSPGETSGWYCRVSEHTPQDATFDEFWSKLSVDKGENEVKYVDVLKKATLIKQISPTQAIWSLYYRFTPPLSPRVFTVLHTIHLDANAPRTGIIISTPIDLSSDPELSRLEEKGVKGHYASVEQLKELDDGNVEWRMATTSSAGGLIPQFLTEMSMPKNISHDVPNFLNWLRSSRTSETPADTEIASAGH